MANTYTYKNGDGNLNTTFPFTFPYIKDTDVKVEVKESGAWVTKTKDTHYEFATATTLKFKSYTEDGVTYGAPASGTNNIKIYRSTGADKLTATFYPGSAIRSADLNDNFTQNLYSTEESKETGDDAQLATDTLVGVTYDGGTTWTQTGDGVGSNPKGVKYAVTEADAAVVTADLADATADTAKATADDAADDVKRWIKDGDGSDTVGDEDDADFTARPLKPQGVPYAVAQAAAAVSTANTARDNAVKQSGVTPPGGANAAITIAEDAYDNAVKQAGVTPSGGANAAITIAEDAYDNAVKQSGVTPSGGANSAISIAESAADDATDAVATANSASTTAAAAFQRDGSAKMTGDIVFDPDGASHETTLTVETPSGSNKTVTLPNETGTVVTTVSTNVIDSDHYVGLSIDEAHIATSAVTNVKLGPDAVTHEKIIDDAIKTEHYSAASINTEHIASLNITRGLIAENAIDSGKLDDNAVTIAKIGCEETTLTPTSDTTIPTSKAVNDHVVSLLNDAGGFRPIADKDSFPETNPDPDDGVGTIISIADAGGLVVGDGSGGTVAGQSKTGDTITTDAEVTINGIDSSLHGTTIEAGKGMLVQTTDTLNTYTYHRLVLDEAGIASADTLITNFNERYRTSASRTEDNHSSNHDGDLYFDQGTNTMYVYDGDYDDGGSWKQVTSAGEHKYLYLCPTGDSGAPTLGGASYDLREGSNSGSPATVSVAAQLTVSVNGVIQKPNTGTTAPSEGFALVDGNSIIFGANIPANSEVFIIQSGSATTINTPANLSVTEGKIASAAVTTAKIADDAVDGAKLANNIDIAGTLDVTGAATFDSAATFGGNASNGIATGAKASNEGYFHATRATTTWPIWAGYTQGSGGANGTLTSEITAGGAATFAGDVQVGADPDASGGSTNGAGAIIDSDGVIHIRRATNNNLFVGLKTGTAPATSLITSDGNASFKGAVTAGSDGTLTEKAFSALNNDATDPTIYAANYNSSGKLWSGINAGSGSTETSSILASGAATFTGYINTTAQVYTGDAYNGNAGCYLAADGLVMGEQAVSGNDVFRGKYDGNTTSTIKGSGTASFAGDLRVGGTAAYDGVPLEVEVQGSTAGAVGISLINTKDSDASATCIVRALQDGRRGGDIVFGRENASDWGTVGNADGFISFNPALNGSAVEGMRISSDGKVGIGTTAPAMKFSVVGSNSMAHFGTASGHGGYLGSTLASQTFWSGGSYYDGSWQAVDSYAQFINQYHGTIRFATDSGLTSGNTFTPTERMIITATGNVGIGTTSPATTLEVKKTGRHGIGLGSTSGAGCYIWLDGASNGDGSGSDYSMLEHSSDGDLVFSVGSSSTTVAEHFRIADNGDLTATDTTIGSNSDSRLKTNVAKFTYNLEDFKKYQPKTFDWKNPKLHGNKTGQRGFIAQDVEAIDGYWVDQQVIAEDNADAEFLDADRLVKILKLGKKDAMYISVIQQLLSKIETLETKVAALEAA